MCLTCVKSLSDIKIGKLKYSFITARTVWLCRELISLPCSIAKTVRRGYLRAKTVRHGYLRRGEVKTSFKFRLEIQHALHKYLC